MSNKVMPVVGKDPTTKEDIITGYGFHCPACGHAHVFYVANPLHLPGRPTWTFNGKLDIPTFEPSLLNWIDAHHDIRQYTCHLNLTDGILIFHGDCTHELAGKRVPLPDKPFE